MLDPAPQAKRRRMVVSLIKSTKFTTPPQVHTKVCTGVLAKKGSNVMKSSSTQTYMGNAMRNNRCV